MATAGTLEYLISINSSQLNSGLTNADNKVKNFGNKMSSWAVAKGQLLGRFIEKAGRVTLDFVKDSVKESMSFDKSMSQVAATLGKSTDEVQDLAKFARKMGAETAFTAQEAAEGLNYMALAGYSADKSMKMLPQVLNLAAAGNMELARASDMVTDAESALGLKAGEVESMIDQMAATASRTNTSVEQLGDAILTVGGTAKMMKGGTAELSTVLGVLADNGIKGSEGGTALRNVLLSLSAPTDKAAKQIKKLGVDVYDAEGNMRSLPDIMQDFNEAMDGMTQEERTNIISDIFNKRDLKAVEALLGTSKQKWSDLFWEITASQGAAQQMADTQLDNLNGDVTKFKSAVGEAKLALVEGLTPSLRKLVQKGIGWVQRLTDTFKEKGLKGAIQEAGNILKEAFSEGKAKLKLKLTDYFQLGSDASWMDIARKVVEKLGTYVGKTGSFIKKLILGDDAENKTWTEVATALTDKVQDAFKEGGIFDIILGDLSDKAKGFATFMGDFIKEFASWMTTHTSDITDMIGTIVSALAESIAPVAEAVFSTLVSLLSDEKFYQGLIDGIGNILKGVAKGILGDDAYNFLFGEGKNGEKKGVIPQTLENEKIAGQNTYGDAYNADELQAMINGEKPLEVPAEVKPEIPDDWNFGDEYTSEEINQMLFGEDQPKVDYQPDFTDVEGADVPTLHGTVEYTPSFSDSDVITTPFGKTYHRRKKAKGDWNVPYDNFPALLHRGEMVLTKSQARQYRDGNMSGTGEIVSALQGLRNDMQNMRLVVGQKTFGRAVVDYGGSRVGNYIGKSDSRLAAGYGT